MVFNGAVEQIRTVDLFLTKEVLCLLSYNSKKMATRKGLEPSTSGVTGRRSNRLSYRAIGRGSRDRTHGTRFWRPLLYQLSYTPIYIR